MSYVDSDKGPPATTEAPRPAAAVILLRRSGKHNTRALEVLLVKRNANARFMPGVWVFPGGAVEGGIGTGCKDDLHFRKTAVRELAEETSIDLSDIESLMPWSRWITPTEVNVRYDVRFYVALAPAHSPPTPDQREIVDAGWFRPTHALRCFREGKIDLVFPTIKHLEELTGYDSADTVLKAARSRSMEPVRPRVVTVDGEARTVLPGEPGYQQ